MKAFTLTVKTYIPLPKDCYGGKKWEIVVQYMLGIKITLPAFNFKSCGFLTSSTCKKEIVIC